MGPDRRDQRDHEGRGDDPSDVVDDVVDREDASAVPIGQRSLHDRVDGDLLPREGQTDDEARHEDRPVSEVHGGAEQTEPTHHERARDDSLLAPTLLEPSDRHDAEQHADPARSDYVGI